MRISPVRRRRMVRRRFCSDDHARPVVEQRMFVMAIRNSFVDFHQSSPAFKGETMAAWTSIQARTFLAMKILRQLHRRERTTAYPHRATVSARINGWKRSSTRVCSSRDQVGRITAAGERFVRYAAALVSTWEDSAATHCCAARSLAGGTYRQREPMRLGRCSLVGWWMQATARRWRHVSTIPRRQSVCWTACGTARSSPAVLYGPPQVNHLVDELRPTGPS